MTNKTDWHLASVWENISDAIPKAPAVRYNDIALTWREYDERAARLAQVFAEAKLDVGSKVAIYSHNRNEYLEAQYAAFKARLVPINVNYRYLEAELAHVLNNSDSEVVVFEAEFAPRIRSIRSLLSKVALFIEINDGSGEHLEGAVCYEEVVAAAIPMPRIPRSGDDIYMLYTGGTTGMPKGVMYPVTDFTEFFMRGMPSMIGLDPFETADAFAPMARQMVDAKQAVVAMSGPPLMHGTGCWLGLMFPHMLGGTSVLLESRGFKPEEVWDAVDRNQIAQMVIVGDAFAKPLLRALEAEPDRWNTSSLRLMTSSGAMFTTPVKRGLIERRTNEIDAVVWNGMTDAAVNRFGDLLEPAVEALTVGGYIAAVGRPPPEEGT